MTAHYNPFHAATISTTPSLHTSPRLGIFKRFAHLITKKSRPSEPYAFPITDAPQEFANLAPGELARLLENLAMYVSSGPVSEWRDLRLRICAIHLALNAHGEIPPLYRARPVPHLNQPDDGMALTFTRDMQVIDMAWSANIIRVRDVQAEHNVSEGGIASVCWNGTFDFAMASAFASSPMSQRLKREALHLPLSVGYETATLQTEAEAIRWDELMGPATEVEKYMLEAGYADEHPWSSDYRWMYLADQLGKGLPYGAIRDAFSYMTGQWMSAHEFRSKVRWLRSIARECLG